MHNVVALETNPTSGTCCANFKNVVSATSEGHPGAVGQAGSSAGVLEGPDAEPSRRVGWGSPRLVFAWGDAQLSPPQLLKKIKRCERKGSESVTEEKCAVLFSTTVALTPSNLSVHLQVPAPLPQDGAEQC